MTDFPLCRGEMDKQPNLDECHYQKREWFGEDGRPQGRRSQGCIWARKCFVESFKKKQLEDLMRLNDGASP